MALQFSILNALALDDRRDFVIVIDPELSEELEDQDVRKGPLRGRRLVTAVVAKLRFANVYVVDTLHEMLEISLVLVQTANARSRIARYSTVARNSTR